MAERDNYGARPTPGYFGDDSPAASAERTICSSGGRCRGTRTRQASAAAQK